MKIIPKTKKDFAWAKYGPKEIHENIKKSIKKIDQDVKKIKQIQEKSRTFENTILGIEQIGENGTEDSPLAFLSYVREDATVRRASKEYQEKLSEKVIEVSFDKDLYRAFLEYNPKSEKLSSEEFRLWKDIDTSFKDKGFHLSEKKQKELKEISKKLSVLGIKFQKNIDDYHAEILCTDEELIGLPATYIANLKIDKKTGKRAVTLAYPEYDPFMKFADNEKKRKELADKRAPEGGKENIKLLKEMLRLRKQYAKLLGYESFADLEAKDAIAKSGKTIHEFLEKTTENLKRIVDRDHERLISYVAKKFPGKKLAYYNSAYYANKMQQDLFAYDPNEVKEYFELNETIQKMFAIFGTLFGVSFKKNITFPVWHQDAQIFDMIEKGKVVGHIGFDLFPRSNKYSHMACWPLVPGRAKKRKSEEYLAPVSVIVGNFPVGNKEHPSLLSVNEMVTLFHEFGHALHGALSRAKFFSQSGTNVLFDFVETPSQLFENWVRNKENLKFISKHYKTSKKISDELLNKVIGSLEFMKASKEYYTFVLSLQDHEMHSNKWNIDPLKLAKEFDKKYFKIPGSPKSLFPAGWEHMVGYAAKYYSYMWALVYSYDIFSRFKKEGIMNKKVGMELRRKILEKGDSEDPIKLMTDFLGRKPNNKAFLEALK